MTRSATNSPIPAIGSISRSGFDVCIITTAIICDNPRVVKEADALAAAGHRVRVVAYESGSAENRVRDAATVRGKNWRLDTVPIARSTASLRWTLATIRQRVARMLYRAGVRQATVRDWAVSKHLDRVANRAAEEHADLVIAHHVPALPAANRAARKLGAALGFDAEDLHAEDMPVSPRFRIDRALIGGVERDYLPCCSCITASAPGIADELARRYRVPRPYVVLNVFPLADAPEPKDSERPPSVTSLYWYSQVVGLDRGLQDVIRAMALAKRRTQLYLRGFTSPETRAALVGLAHQLGLPDDSVVFLAPALPTDLITLAAEYDIGLALEQPVTLNRKLCITNKILAYLTAGIAVLATDVPGQRAVMEQALGAGCLYEPGDAAALAAAIDRLTASDATLAEARAAARRAARSVFSWELVAPGLVDYLESRVMAAKSQAMEAVS